MNYENLLITAKLRTGILCDEWLPLDGIVYYQLMRDRFGAQVATLPGGNKGSSAPDAEMPFAVIPSGDAWYYACSWAYPTANWWICEGTDSWNKRFAANHSDIIDFGDKNGVVETRKGQYKAYHMPIFYKVAAEISWYCVGDADILKYLLAHTPYIGKKRSQGWGNVISWHIESADNDYSVMKDGKLTRGVPLQDAPYPCEEMYYGLHPPYYVGAKLIARP